MRPRRFVSGIDGRTIRLKRFNWARCGCNKLAYTSRKIAAAVAKQESRASGEPIRAYHCRRGHVWHIGHPPGWRAQQDEAPT